MIKVSITADLCTDPTARHFAQIVARCLSNLPTSALLGCRGGFERNANAMAAGIEKFHIRMPDDIPWPSHVPINRRTSNNFLVFARHFYDDDYFQILALVSPDAHQRIDAMLPRLIDLAENTFIELSDEDLDRLEHFTV
ncbi:type II toxin-antitoxin system YafO family toxin [Serratia liquefaciens]|uniref:type II toxin-antitoxin system YafO family toxin n=1 Tax=Serratia liquefaciens TaxID=614 RepID=UPI0018A76A9E|nr:type II toxin-antitoxin system YafO family toxin [Serratia liquefaciens]MBF8103876.1 type II toxin-antitoxin system YafO family toxin [Serratia liquefaciens]